MSELYEIENNTVFITVNCFAFKNFSDVELLVKQIASSCAKYNRNRILIQNYSGQQLSPLYCILIIKILKDAGITEKHMLAIVNPLKNYLNNDDKFLVTVAMNRGWYNIKVFETIDNARKWLSR